MLDLANLRALLYPHGVRMDSAPGGVPEFTVEDANAAWGILQTRDRMACVVVESLYAHPLILTDEAHMVLKRAQLRECWRRLRAVEVWKQSLDVAEEEAQGTHGGVPGVRRAVARAKAELETARAAKWPRYSPRYRLIRQAAAEELMKNIPCRTCGGRRTVRAGELSVVCHACSGRGREPASERIRAQAIGMSRVTFARDWAGVFDFTLGTVADLRERARKEMRAILSQVAA